MADDDPALFPAWSVNIAAPIRDEPRGSAKIRRWVRSDDNRTWLAKGFEKPSSLFAEAIGYQLADVLGANPPRRGLARTNELCALGRLWCSEEVLRAMPWKDDLQYAVDDLSRVGVVHAIDALIYVSDRHVQNLLMQPTSDDDLALRVWVVDFDQAQMADPTIAFDLGMRVPHPRADRPRADVDVIRDAALAAAVRFRGWSDDELAQMSQRAAKEVGAPLDLASSFTEAMTPRKRGATALVDDYLNAIEAAA